MNQPLTLEQREIMIEAHQAERNKRQADRIKTILLLDEGRPYSEIAKILLLDDTTIRRYEKEYQTDGLDNILEDNYKGGPRSLSVIQEEELKLYIAGNIYHRAKDITEYIKKEYQTVFTPEGLVHTLHRLGFSYKKTKQVPGKVDPEKQEEFLKTYQEIKKNMNKNDELYFLDGSHPQHNSMPAYAWILTGEEKEIKTNTGRQRLNLNGALNGTDHSVVVQAVETINAEG
jgi:transposase